MSEFIKKYFPSAGMRFEKVMTLLDAKKDEMILDAGSGIGILDRKVSSSARLVVGMDIKKDFVIAAKRLSKSMKNMFFVIGNVESLPFKPNIFDKIFSSEVIEHLANPKKFLSDIHSSVKNGGSVIITTPNGNTNILSRHLPIPLPSRLLGKLTHNPKLLHPYGHMHDCFSKKELIEMIEMNRLKIEAVNYCGSFLTKILDDIVYTISVIFNSNDEVQSLEKKGIIMRAYMNSFPLIRAIIKMDFVFLKLNMEGYITIITALKE